MKLFKNVSFVLADGSFGGLVKALAAVTFTYLGINTALGSAMGRVLSPQLLYDHVVNGSSDRPDTSRRSTPAYGSTCLGVACAIRE